jgi:hypothetical protein
MIFVKQHIVELSLIDHFVTPATLVEMPRLRFAQLVKGSGNQELIALRRLRSAAAIVVSFLGELTDELSVVHRTAA